MLILCVAFANNTQSHDCRIFPLPFLRRNSDSFCDLFIIRSDQFVFKIYVKEKNPLIPYIYIVAYHSDSFSRAGAYISEMFYKTF